MILLCFVLLFITARKVKIMSSDSPLYTMMIIPNLKGGLVRMMKEENIKNVDEQEIFKINGETTQLENNKTSICTKIFGPDIVTCKRNLSKDTFFHIINIANDVKFETSDNKCLSISEYDIKNKGYCLKLENCEDTPQQMFKMIDVTEKETIAPINEKYINDVSNNLYPKSNSNDNPSENSSEDILNEQFRMPFDSYFKNSPEFNEYRTSFIRKRQVEELFNFNSPPSELSASVENPIS